jgi:heme-binding NEAT domain protein
MKKAAANKKVKEDDDGATAPPPKDKTGQYPIITSGPNKGKRWTPGAPGPTAPTTPSPTTPSVKESAGKKCNHTAKGKSCPVHGMKECSGMMEAKPSAGMSKGEKSAVVKKAKSGGDIGKPGKSFDKVAKAAGGGEKGTKIAAAAMWKNQAK